MTESEVQARLEELKKNPNREVDKETIEKLRELRAQVYSVKTYKEKLEEAVNRKPKKEKDITENVDKYYKQKSIKCYSTFFSTISIFVAIIAFIALIVFCVLDAVKGYKVFYNPPFTLTYLFKVIGICFLCGVVGALIIMGLGWCIDKLIDKINLATYDKKHAKELEEAKLKDKQANENYFENFKEKKEKDIASSLVELKKAQEFVDKFNLVPAELKNIDIIDKFFENMQFVMNDGVPFDIALYSFMQLFEVEKKAGLYYFSAFPLTKPYSKEEMIELDKKVAKILNKHVKKFTTDQFNHISKEILTIYKAMAIRKFDISLTRLEKIKTKKDCEAFYEEFLTALTICTNMLNKRGIK